MPVETRFGGQGDQGGRRPSGPKRDLYDLNAQISQPLALGEIAPDSPEALQELYEGRYTRRAAIDRIYDQRKEEYLRARWKYGATRLTWGYYIRYEAEKKLEYASVNLLAIETIRKFDLDFAATTQQKGETNTYVGTTPDRKPLTIHSETGRVIVGREGEDQMDIEDIFSNKDRKIFSSSGYFRFWFLSNLGETIEAVNSNYKHKAETLRAQEHKKRVIRERMRFFDITYGNSDPHDLYEVDAIYDASDPYFVTFLFNPHAKKEERIAFSIGRDLLKRGVEAWRGESEGLGIYNKVATSIDDGMKTILRFMTDNGPMLLHADRAKLAKFLRRTRKVVPYGFESHFSGDVIKGLRIPDQP